MTGEYIIQQSILMRSQGYFREAIACIEKNINKVSPALHETAWREAQFSAQELGDQDLVRFYTEKADALGVPGMSNFGNGQPPLQQTA